MTFKDRIKLKLLDWIIGKPPTEINVGNKNHDKRTEWVINKLKNLPKGTKLLDVGAGELFFKPYCEHLEYVSQDFSAFSPDDLQEGAQPPSWDYGELDIVSDITEIPRPDASFDAILCSEVLEHVPNPILAIQEMSRLLKPNGTLLITAPFNSYVHFAPYHFASGLSQYFYKHHFSENGLVVKELTPNGNLFEHLAQNLSQVQNHGEKYVANKEFSPFERRQVLGVLKTLESLSQNDTKSFEMNCYGWFVEGQKTQK